MYSCMLPYQLWDLPNRMTNCEDVLMNMISSVATGQPAGMPYQPAFGIQDDYGTPPPKELKHTNPWFHPQALSGLSGAAEKPRTVLSAAGNVWTDARTQCTNRLAEHFQGAAAFAAGAPLPSPAFMAVPPWREIPFEKRWLMEGRGGSISSPRDVRAKLSGADDAGVGGHIGGRPSGTTALVEGEVAGRSGEKRWPAMHALIQDGVVDGLLKFEADYLSANSTLVPTVRASVQCPSREDVMNTALVRRWDIWDDGPDCVDGCWLSECDHVGFKVAPCCVKRLEATFTAPCSERTHGCDTPDSLYRRHQVLVSDQGILSVPQTVPSARCPYRGSVANTKPSERWKIWQDATPKGTMGESCEEGCALQNCDGGKLVCRRRPHAQTTSFPGQRI